MDMEHLYSVPRRFGRRVMDSSPYCPSLTGNGISGLVLERITRIGSMKSEDERPEIQIDIYLIACIISKLKYVGTKQCSATRQQSAKSERAP
jgi:hypothetical protein